MSPKSLIVIGGGPGGFAAALDASRTGMSVTLIDSGSLGGTCLNRGCIPSKFFLSHGERGPLQEPMSNLLNQKDTLLNTLRSRMESAIKAGKIQWITGNARLLSAHEVECTTSSTTNRLSADFILLATGTAPSKPSFFPDHPAILDSSSILNLSKLPAHLVVVGGGYIGCEMACAFHGLGSKVTLIEKENRLLAIQEEFENAAGTLSRSFQKRGIQVWTNVSVENVHVVSPEAVRISCSNGEEIETDAVLVAIGRRAHFEPLGLDQVGITPHNGRIPTSNTFQTSVPSIYAIGDIVNQVPLAHVATKEAEVAVAHMNGKLMTIDYKLMPRCVYTWPEAAAIGHTEKTATEAGLSPQVHRYHFLANAKALIENETEGQWIIVTDKTTGKILGSQITGAHATELIHLIALSIRGGLTLSDVADTVFAHPSLSESFQESMKRGSAHAH